MARDSLYQAYLIRFQRSDEKLPWRVTLKNTQNDEVKQFATEKEALRFLFALLTAPKPTQPAEFS